MSSEFRMVLDRHILNSVVKINDKFIVRRTSAGQLPVSVRIYQRLGPRCPSLYTVDEAVSLASQRYFFGDQSS